jgi:hypothetical protein
MLALRRASPSLRFRHGPPGGSFEVNCPLSDEEASLKSRRRFDGRQPSRPPTQKMMLPRFEVGKYVSCSWANREDGFQRLAGVL